MLEEIRIRSLGVIDTATLELSGGLTVLTGETGAGKTMVLTALGLVLGNKAESSLVRNGAAQALVTARIQFPQESKAYQIATDTGAEIEEDSAILVRSITSEGRSRASIGGVPVTATTLAQLTAEVIAIHAQTSNARLLRPSAQREILDRFGGAAVATALAEYQSAYQDFKECQVELTRLRELAKLADRELSELRALVEDVAQVDPQIGELEQIADEVTRLSNIDELRQAVQLAHDLFDSGDSDGLGAIALLNSAQRSLEKVRAKDHNLDRIYEQLSDPILLLREIQGELASYQGSLDADPLKLESLQARKAGILTLLRRHATTWDEGEDGISAIKARADEAATRLASRENIDAEVSNRTAELTELESRLAHAATALTKSRRLVADQAANLITKKIHELAMPNATFTIDLTSRHADDGLPIDGELFAYGPSGIDEIEMLLSAHRGGVAVPLARSASGGELSRVMLAIEVVLAAKAPLATFVFDEIDAGVGGKAAVEVGRQLSELARHAQVIVVTHLAQVAAFADNHFTVTKSEDGSVTASGVQQLAKDQRIIELARMLAGQESSASAQQHAEELLELARRP